MTPRTSPSLLAAWTLVPLTLLSIVAAPARAQDLLWQFGTSGMDVAFALAPDDAAGVFVAGLTDGNLGGPHAGGLFDIFLARYDSAGERVWIRQFGTSERDGVYDLTPDGAGGVIVAGFTRGSLGGPNAGRYDAYLARYDDAGNQVWLRQFGTAGDEVAHALAPDGAGGVLVVGGTDGSLGGPNAGGADAFLARFNIAGDRIWIRQYGTSGNENASLLASDGAGGALVAGITDGPFGGPYAGNSDVYLARFSSTGERLWIRQFGTSGYDTAYDLVSDGDGGLIVAGRTNGDLARPALGGWDAFLARYDSKGERRWFHQFGTRHDDVANTLAPDGAGGVIVAGRTRGRLGGPNAGLSDIFVAHYNSAGDRVWIRQFGTPRPEYAHAQAPDGAGGVMIAGRTKGNLGGPNRGRADVFVARFSICYSCDMNCDGDVNEFDIEPFLDLLFGPGIPCDTCTGDVNGDGNIDAFDIEPFLDCLFEP